MPSVDRMSVPVGGCSRLVLRFIFYLSTFLSFLSWILKVVASFGQRLGLWARIVAEISGSLEHVY